jgi:hypothetical protein
LIHLNSCDFDTSKSFNSYDFTINEKKLWTKNDISKFKEGLEKLGKNFFKIRKEFVRKFTASI